MSDELFQEIQDRVQDVITAKELVREAEDRLFATALQVFPGLQLEVREIVYGTTGKRPRGRPRKVATDSAPSRNRN